MIKNVNWKVFFLDYVDQRDNSFGLEKNIYTPSYGEDVVNVKSFETRKWEWTFRDVASIPEVL